MKKSIAVGMVLLATVVFSGCSTQKEDNSAKSNNSKTEQTTKKKTKNKFEKTNQKMIDAQKMPISLDKYFSYSGYDIKSGLDEEYKIAKSTKELMGNYSFKDDNKTSLLTINKNGTYTIFSSFPDVDLESNDVVTYGHYYFDKNGEVHQKSQLVNTSVESGVLFQKYGKTYMYPIDLVNNPQSVDENGQLVVIARQNLLETKDDFKQRKIDNVDLIDVSRTNGCDVIKKNNDGISLQVLQKDAESDDGFVNKYG
ncbi:hypothetical protein OF389_09905, partial [Companilactobacillus farciminis]|nr:hypothetical protein [Companilactobacillus farciminis]